METTAEEVDGGFVLNGAKTWISNAPVASVRVLCHPVVVLILYCRDLFVVWARCKWDGKVRGFLIEKVSVSRNAYLQHIDPWHEGRKGFVGTCD